MPLIKSVLTVGFLLLLTPAYGVAACVGQIPRYVQLKVDACFSPADSLKLIMEGKDYSKEETGQVEHSAKYISLIEVRLVADVEIIRWNAKGVEHLFKGKVTPIKSNESRQFMSLLSLESCKKSYEGKTQLFVVYDNYSCCRDVIVPGWKETAAQCLIGLPLADSFGKQLDGLTDIGIALPGNAH